MVSKGGCHADRWNLRPRRLRKPASRRFPPPTAKPAVGHAARARALPMPSLEWTPEVERATAHLYERVKNVISPVEWPFMAPYVKAINELKRDTRRGHPGA